MTNHRNRSMGQLADAAFLQAAEKVLKRAEDAGTTVVLSENGKIIEADPRKLRAKLKKKAKKR